MCEHNKAGVHTESLQMKARKAEKREKTHASGGECRNPATGVYGGT